MSIGSRVIYWLRGELNAIFRPEGWPRDRRPRRRQAGSASSEHEPSSEGARRRRHSPTGADQARNPVLSWLLC